jgi:hypothetical protein
MSEDCVKCSLAQYCHDETLKDVSAARDIKEIVKAAIERFNSGYTALAEVETNKLPKLISDLILRLEHRHLIATGREDASQKG